VHAPSASADTCQYFAGYGVKVCGEWNATVTTGRGVTHAKTSSFRWTVSRLDRTVRILDVKVRTGGLSNCWSGWSGCTRFNKIAVVSRAATGTTYTAPSWAGRWGQVQGVNNFQMSNLTLTWCRGTTCKTVTTANTGGGTTDVPSLTSGK
jgi:hypothetical protein